MSAEDFTQRGECRQRMAEQQHTERVLLYGCIRRVESTGPGDGGDRGGFATLSTRSEPQGLSQQWQNRTLHSFAALPSARGEQPALSADVPALAALGDGLQETVTGGLTGAGEMSGSTKDDWQQVQRIFAAAVELAPRQRLAFVREECAGDERLYREVATLVEEFDTALDEFETPLRMAFEEPDVDEERPHVSGYEIHEELHRGGQGVVYRATQLATKRKVAIKFLLSGPFASESARRRFQREVELASQLRHSGIVRLFDGGVASGQPWFVMEYVDGRQLQTWVAEQDPDLTARLTLFAGICDAVGAAHSSGVIHRDLKPSNVMVTQDGEPRVLDFGLAKSLTPNDDRLSVTGQVMGTLAYMSPEQAGGRDVTAATDVYSLAVILYELLSGHLPYELTGSIAQKLLTIQSGEYTPLARFTTTVPRGITAIIDKGLSESPAQRYAAANAMAADIRRFLAGEPVEARQYFPGQRLGKLVRRHSVRMGLAVAVLAGFAAGVWGVGMFAGAPPIAGPLQPLTAGEHYGTEQLESQMHAMQDLLRREASAAQIVEEFQQRFGELQPVMFQQLTAEREADLRLLLSVRTAIAESQAALRASLEQQLLAPGPAFTGMAQDIAQGVLTAADAVSPVE